MEFVIAFDLTPFTGLLQLVWASVGRATVFLLVYGTIGVAGGRWLLRRQRRRTPDLSFFRGPWTRLRVAMTTVFLAYYIIGEESAYYFFVKSTPAFRHVDPLFILGGVVLGTIPYLVLEPIALVGLARATIRAAQAQRPSGQAGPPTPDERPPGP
jgi:hypothetical protein